MRTWLAVVTVQLVTKSYPYRHKTRVQAYSAAVAANKATREAFIALRGAIKGRRLQSVRVDLTNLGPVQSATVHHEEARV